MKLDAAIEAISSYENARSKLNNYRAGGTTIHRQQARLHRLLDRHVHVDDHLLHDTDFLRMVVARCFHEAEI